MPTITTTDCSTVYTCTCKCLGRLSSLRKCRFSTSCHAKVAVIYSMIYLSGVTDKIWGGRNSYILERYITSETESRLLRGDLGVPRN